MKAAPLELPAQVAGSSVEVSLPQQGFIVRIYNWGGTLNFLSSVSFLKLPDLRNHPPPSQRDYISTQKRATQHPLWQPSPWDVVMRQRTWHFCFTWILFLLITTYSRQSSCRAGMQRPPVLLTGSGLHPILWDNLCRASSSSLSSARKLWSQGWNHTKIARLRWSLCGQLISLSPSSPNADLGIPAH